MQILHYCFDWPEGDLDNIAKPILDALCGVAFFNDNQIVQLHMKRTDLAKHRVTQIEGASTRLLGYLEDAISQRADFVYISVSDSPDHTRIP